MLKGWRSQEKRSEERCAVMLQLGRVDDMVLEEEDYASTL
jgi:hypothetical protein